MFYDMTHFTSAPEMSVLLNIHLWILCFDLQNGINDYHCGFKGDMYRSKQKYVFDSKSLMYYVDLLLAFHTQMEAN